MNKSIAMVFFIVLLLLEVCIQVKLFSSPHEDNSAFHHSHYNSAVHSAVYHHLQ